jgi:hypothetical protein
MMRKIIWVIVISFIVSSLAACSSSSVPSHQVLADNVSLDMGGSYFSDFEVSGDSVLVYCVVTLENHNHKGIRLKLNGNFEEDVTIGLLKSENLTATNRGDNSQIFTLPANARATFDVVFVGEFGGTNMKNDRLLPTISAEVTG